MAVDVSDIKPGCVVRTDAGCVAVVDGINDEDYVQLLLAGPRADMGIHANHIAEIIAPAQEVDHGDGTVTRVTTLPVRATREQHERLRGIRMDAGFASDVVIPQWNQREPTAAERALAESDWPLLTGTAEWLTAERTAGGPVLEWTAWTYAPELAGDEWFGQGGTSQHLSAGLVHPLPPITPSPAGSLIELAVVQRLREEAGR